MLMIHNTPCLERSNFIINSQYYELDMGNCPVYVPTVMLEVLYSLGN